MNSIPEIAILVLFVLWGLSLHYISTIYLNNDPAMKVGSYFTVTVVFGLVAVITWFVLN